ncbi:MAG: hypothetical protein LW690_09425 [Opitutaceae bacterium]|jgi:hypothetical protein|nr:hypothetical protein [Opitutaceae bacterium]
MGFINTKPVEQVMRDVFRKNKVATFWDIVKAGLPLAETISYSDGVALESNDDEERLYQYELALDLCLKNYHAYGLVYPVKWRAILEQYVDMANVFGKLNGVVNGINFTSNARLEESYSRWKGFDDPPYETFAGAISRVLNGCRDSAPPWFEKNDRYRGKISMRASIAVVNYFALPEDEYANEVARPSQWIASERIFDAPHLVGFDL